MSIPTNAELLSQLAALKAENEALKAKKSQGRVSLKVSAKGAVSLYGMGRFPVTLYAQQWGTVLSMAESIKGFIESNKASLATEADKVAYKAAQAAEAAKPTVTA